MASKVLKSFLIGIGYDTKALEAGDKKINASLNGIKSGALGISAALVGAFGAGAGVVASTANKIDRLAAATQNMRTPMNTVYNFGNAVELMGGQASEAYESLKRLEEFQNNFRLNGNDGALDPLATAGMDVGALTRTVKHGDGMDLYRELERQYKEKRPDEGQRAQVQSTFGFSDFTARLLNRGGADEKMAQSASYTGSIDQMTESARRFSESNAILSQKFEGMANELTEKFLPSLIGASEWTNKFLSEHRGDISKGIDYAADNPGATTALLTSSVSSVLGPIISKLGLSSIGSVATKAGAVGLVGTGSAIGSNLVNQGLDKYVPGYRGVSQGFDDLLKGVTGLDRIPGPLDLMSGRFPSAVDQPKVSTSPSVSAPPVQQNHYKEVPSQNVDDLVKAQMAARHNMDRDASVLNQRDMDDSLSGVVDRRPPEAIYGDRSAADSMPPQESADDSYKDVQSQNGDDLVRAIQRAKVNVNNNLTIQLDGRELDARIIQVNERQNYEAAEDFKPTTER
ncbi:hypothetical protein ACEK06_11590 [Pseudomonas brenneri]|uniref:hypothetical protein n=1 Tax=Pseudomonas brenneri TaxID=129817 RepID=UPI003570ECF9